MTTVLYGSNEIAAKAGCDESARYWHVACVVAATMTALPLSGPLASRSFGMLGPSLALGLFIAACGSSDGKGSSGGAPNGNQGGSSNGGSSSTTAGASAAAAALCPDTTEPGDMIAIPAGAFEMGCDDATDPKCSEDEKPMHHVTLSAFELDRTEVTQAAYTACIADGACQPPSCEWSCEHPDFPAGCVTWSQANAYCSWAGKRLPSEAEWEKAARGEASNKYPWGASEPSCSLANIAGCGDALRPVGSFGDGASPYGALDMAGNVVELVADWYADAYYAESPAADPKGPATGKRYGGRGGGFKSDADFVRASKRDWYDPTDAAPSLGFRCAR